MKSKIIVLLLLINLISCKKTKENQSETYNKKIYKTENKGKVNTKFNFDNFLISKGQIGEIKIGMSLNNTEKYLREMTRKEVEAYDFGYGGGGKAYIYSIYNEPIFALITNFETKSIIAIIAISNKLKTNNGLNPNSKVVDILKIYPKMVINQDDMTSEEFMYDEKNKWSFIFKTNEKNRIGEYTDIEESTKPKRIKTKMNYIEIK